MKIENTKNKVEMIIDNVPNTNILKVLEALSEAYKESKVTERELSIINAKKEFLLTEIELKYELYHDIFRRIFDERQTSVNKSFEIIDRGLASDDKELISDGLRTLSQIVSSSPFNDLNKLSELIEGEKIITI